MTAALSAFALVLVFAVPHHGAASAVIGMPDQKSCLEALRETDRDRKIVDALCLDRRVECHCE